MKEQIIATIEQHMLASLDNAQMELLHHTLLYCLENVQLVQSDSTKLPTPKNTNDDLLAMFLAAKKVEGCSDKTLRYYRVSIEKLLSLQKKHISHMTTDHLRQYLADYQKERGCSKANLDNLRRIFSSFFAWLEDENYILKSPVRRIHKIRMEKTVKETYSDETLETMRDHCLHIRDLAMIDLLASTGMRVGELVQLNIPDLDFAHRECIVFGKGNKERPVYFDARTKLHLQEYIASRHDENPALFVSLLKPFNRLAISGVEVRLRKLGQRLNLPRVHPHKFRRTLATRAIDKGMPIEQVQRLLGHAKIDTTMEYAMVSQRNVKISHEKYIC